jgi:4-hydroxy-4-methyl-2-oxoglutarate aldolase
MKMGTVVRNRPQVAEEKLALLRGFGVATVHEAMGRTGLMKPYLRPIFPAEAIAGNAVTVLVHPGDNWTIHVALELCRPNDVVVVALSSDCTDAMVGELIGSSMVARGVIGAVIDAGCRDVADLTRMRFPVWSRGASAKGTIKATLGTVNVPVVCAGAQVHAGDVIVADVDGVVVVPHAQVGAAISASRERVEREQRKRLRLQAGELGLDIDNMRPALEKAGIRYYDTLDDAEIAGREQP